MPGDEAQPYLVLVVEDDPNDAFLVERAFQKCGGKTEVKVVSTVDEAIEFLTANQEPARLPVVILQDIKLPLKSGFEFVGWLRQQPGLKRLPVIMLTSSKAPQDVNRAYELGANSYLVKPVAFEAFVNTVKALEAYWLVHNEQPQILLVPPAK